MELKRRQKEFFSRELINWHREAILRVLPWKKERDPYRIWLSEIILQQTRAEQGIPYYLKFIEHYPTLDSLAAARDEEVFRLWQGLGYYNRCRNLLGTARHIVTKLGSTFPDNYEDLIKLKGIGPYTAAAIASFSFGEPRAVVDGNVNRVLARYAGIETPFDSSEGKKQFQTLADDLLVREHSAEYNQSIMDFGATVCTPANPQCMSCPMQKNCVAYREGLVKLLPVKSRKPEVKKRYFHYLLLTAGDKVWIRQRTEKDIWQHLHELFLIEQAQPLKTEEIRKHSICDRAGSGKLDMIGSVEKQRLTHQLIETRFYKLETEEPFLVTESAGNWVSANELKSLAFPKTLVSFLEKNFYF